MKYSKSIKKGVNFNIKRHSEQNDFSEFKVHSNMMLAANSSRGRLLPCLGTLEYFSICFIPQGLISKPNIDKSISEQLESNFKHSKREKFVI